MPEVTLEVIDERLRQIHKHNIVDHEEMKAGIKHTNGDVSVLKLNEAKRNGQIQILTLVVGSILVPLVVYFLKIKLFD